MDAARLAASLMPLGIYALAVPIPGPSFVLISRASLCRGIASGSATAFGTTAGVVVYAFATVFGLTTLTMALPWLVGAIQVAGGAYLLFMGFSLLRFALSREAEPETFVPRGERESWGRSFRRGLYVGLGNPKMAAFFLGLFSPVVGDAMPFSKRWFVLAGIVSIDLVYHQALARIAATGQPLMGKVGRWFDAAAGICMTTFGLGLIARTSFRD